MLRERIFELLRVVVVEHQRVLRDICRNPGAAGIAESQQARAGLDQQAIGMAVIAPFELDDLAAATIARCARARRIALIAASVPDETRRTCSIDGTRA